MNRTEAIYTEYLTLPRPPRLNLMAYPYLPRAEVATTSPRAYMGLLTATPS